jgi:hypothetical protein
VLERGHLADERPGIAGDASAEPRNDLLKIEQLVSYRLRDSTPERDSAAAQGQ